MGHQRMGVVVGIEVKTPALCLQRTQTQGRGTLGVEMGERVGQPAKVRSIFCAELKTKSVSGVVDRRITQNPKTPVKE